MGLSGPAGPTARASGTASSTLTIPRGRPVASTSTRQRAASFRSKELTELIVEGIRHPGFSFIDAFSPCTAFNNTTQEWKESVHMLTAEHDCSDRAAAFAAALEEPMGIGIFYRNERATLDGRVRAMQDAAPAGSVDELLDGFALRPSEPATAR